MKKTINAAEELQLLEVHYLLLFLFVLCVFFHLAFGL